MAHERRFVPADPAATFARLAACLPPDARPVAWVRTTYLDTAELAFSRIGGEGTRRLRVREYAAPAFTGRCFLERKEQFGAERGGARIGLPTDAMTRLLAGERGAITAWGAALATLCPYDDLASQLRAGGVRAWVVTTFRRTALGGAAHGLRITLDEDIGFTRAADGAAIGGMTGAVLEVKWSGTLPAWLVAELAGVREDETLSKFGAAMRCLAVSMDTRPMRPTILSMRGAS